MNPTRLLAMSVSCLLLLLTGCGRTSTEPRPAPTTSRPAVDTQAAAPADAATASPKAASDQEGQPLVVFESGGTEVAVLVEVAREPRELQRGLMFRTHLEAGHGMLFVMPTEQRQRFWMRNTLIPLDMIFIDSAFRVVGIVANAEPRTLTGRGVDTPSKYVVEVPGGYAAAEGIASGDKVRFEHVF